MSSLSSFFFGSPEKTQQLPLYSQQQQQFQNQALQGAGNQLPDILKYLQGIVSQSPEATQAFEAPALRAFQEQTLPSIAERFSSMGGQRSNAFGQQLGQAGASLQENLAAQRANLSNNAIQQLMQILGVGMTQQNENILRPAAPGFLETAGKGIASGIGGAIGGGLVGGPAGAAMGGLWNLFK